MLQVGPNNFLIEHASELPDAAVNAKVLYLDHETTSFKRNAYGDYPWGGHRVCGTAFTWDDCPRAYYVPVRHVDARWNVDLDDYQRWLRDVTRTAGVWANHNVKFDAHFSDAEGALFTGELHDTVVLAKLVDSDRDFGRGGYRLDALSADWLDHPIKSHDDTIQAYLNSLKPKGTKDYALIPGDMMAEYATEDVVAARGLHRYCLDRLEPSQYMTWEIEKMLTPVLFDMERDGMRVDRQQLLKKELQLITELQLLQEALHTECGYPVEPSSSQDCYEFVVNRLGLPCLYWQDDEDDLAEHTPRFDADALKGYLTHPDVVDSEKLVRAFMMLLKYRERHVLYATYVKPFQKLNVDGWLHPQYNQLVRTGRMSCKRPNAQQQSEESKELILPDNDGDDFMSNDASQIEFRLLVHYCDDHPGPIEAYAADPDTDFHQWVADMCQMHRDPAKNVNFCIGYGGGKKKVMRMLSSDMRLVGGIVGEVDQMVADGRVPRERRKDMFEYLATQRANSVYQRYHAMMPGLKRVTDIAGARAKKYGHVFNAYGRIRRLPERAAWRALNSITQGLASDIIKANMVMLAPRYCRYTRELGLKMKANVHDEILWCGPREVTRDRSVQRHLLRVLEEPLVPFRVPLRFGVGVSGKDWATASGKGGKVGYDRKAESGDIEDVGEAVRAHLVSCRVPYEENARWRAQISAVA